MKAATVLPDSVGRHYLSGEKYLAATMGMDRTAEAAGRGPSHCPSSGKEREQPLLGLSLSTNVNMRKPLGCQHICALLTHRQQCPLVEQCVPTLSMTITHETDTRYLKPVVGNLHFLFQSPLRPTVVPCSALMT